MVIGQATDRLPSQARGSME